MTLDDLKIDANMRVVGMADYELVGFAHDVDTGVIDLYASTIIDRTDLSGAVGMHAVYMDASGELWSDPVSVKRIER